MIIKNSSLFSQRQKNFIVIVSLIFDIIIISIIAASLIIALTNDNITDNPYYMIITLFTIFGVISIGDLITIFRKRKSFAFYIIKRVKSKIDPFSKNGINITQQQLQFCEKIIGSKSNNKLIYVFGKENKGKTIAIFYLLKSLTINSLSLDEVPWFNKIIFIDCTNKKREIIDYILPNDPLNRMNRFNDSLIILDNIECLGKGFLDENTNLFASNKHSFILIEDTEFLNPMCNDTLANNALCIYHFKQNYISSIKKEINLYKELISFDSTTKHLFFALYFSTLNSFFVEKKQILKVLNIKGRTFRSSFKRIQQLNLFIYFPYNKSYCYCCRKTELKNIDKLFSNDLIYNSVLKSFIECEAIDYETRWLCLIRSSISTIQLVSQDIRNTLFSKALYDGNYSGLYNELNKAIGQEPNKMDTFLYEKAFLAFYIGNHQEATECFLKLLNRQPNTTKKKELMLHIIESSHGNPNTINMQMIFKMIDELKSYNDFYSICAQYWEVHISSEKGIFSCDDMSKIREKISSKSLECNKKIQRSIIHRTFTDEIRFNHILGNEDIYSLYEKYNEFLSSCGPSRREYYTNLYIEANNIHYLLLLNSVIDPNTSESELIDLVATANYYYEKALSTTYNDEKSKHATKIKQIDLSMMCIDFDFDKAIQAINQFRLHSQLNNVGVHEAFCETLLMKALIVNPTNLSNDFGVHIEEDKLKEICIHFENSKKIFEMFQNAYGIFRLQFIKHLLDLLISHEPNGEKTSLENLERLKIANLQYKKECKIIDYIINNKNNLSKMFIFSLIKAYPIILQ